MLDINKIREKPEEIKRKLLKRMDDVDFTELLEWDYLRRKTIVEVDEMKKRRNEVSKQVPKMKKEGRDIGDLLEEMKIIGEQIKSGDDQIREFEKNIDDCLSVLPNIPDDDVKSGGKENNEVLRTWGEIPNFGFEPLNHVELCVRHNLIDYERGVKMGGSGFWLYRGMGALLEWALLNYFIENHLKDGYEFILPPHILNYECGYTAGQFPKFAEDVYHLKADNEEGFQFLLPTAETALINFHRDEILEESELPKKYFSYTPCYRKEGGSYRTEERGMIRGHQFNKVEMFQYTTPENSDRAFDELVEKAEKLVKELGLHYQVSKLAAKDASSAMAKTYDIEVWIPSMNTYKEVSSASNARDYQSRRGNMKFRRKENGNKEYLHTLNASGLATSRILPAIVENFQQDDGSIIIPEVLRKWTGVEKIV